MLQIFICYDQQELLPLLWAWFPGIILESKTAEQYCYLAPSQEGVEGRAQEHFLQQHAIEYVNLEAERETIIRTFFDGVELEGKQITSIEFRRVRDASTYHSVRLKTEDDEVCLRFPPDWCPHNMKGEISGKPSKQYISL